METRRDRLGLLCLFYVSTAATFLISCEARSSRQFESQSAQHSRSQHLKAVKRLDIYSSSDPYYMGSPNSLPPYNDVMSPSSSPQENPPYCVYPPLTPLPPSTTLPTPTVPIVTPPQPLPSPPPPTAFNAPPVLTPPELGPPSPPELVPTPPTYIPTPPAYVPGPPTIVPSPPAFVPSPIANVPPPSLVPSPPVYEAPPGFVPSPPIFIPSPPGYVPSPPVFVPGPIIFQPPVIYPPPSVPPPPYITPTPALWCVVKPTVPDPIIQEAMNYACGSGADCDSIQPNGSCFQPDTLIAHASFAFNSYYQRTKVAGGTCDFGGTGMLITRDPSYDGCHFIVY